MGRFSPTVAPTWGQSLGHALEGGVDAFLQARRQKQGQEDEMFAKGYRPATDADLQPAPVPTAEPPAPWQPGTPSETNASIVRGVQAAQNPAPALSGPDGAQALSGGPPPNFRGRPQLGQPAVDPALLAQALASHVQSGEPLRSPDAAPVVQPTPQALGQALQRHPIQMGGRQWMRTDEAQAAMDQSAHDRAMKEALTGSEIFKNTAQGTKDLREPRDAPLVQQGHVVDPVTGEVKFFDPTKPPTDLRVHPAPHPAAEVGGAMKFAADQKNKIVDDFRADTKKFEDVRAGWEVLNGALKERSLATPFALADAYARISNPGALVRPSTLDMIHELGSIDQRFRKYAEANIHGQLPEDVTRDFVRTIGAMVKEHAATYNQQRTMALQRGAQSGVRDLEPILPTFEYTDPFAAEHHAGPVIGTSGSRVLNQAPKSVGGDSGNVDLRSAPKGKPVTVNGKTYHLPE